LSRVAFGAVDRHGELKVEGLSLPVERGLGVAVGEGRYEGDVVHEVLPFLTR
jgi:hypothetical protein